MAGNHGYVAAIELHTDLNTNALKGVGIGADYPLSAVR
jgi:hypothetical protein